MLSSNTKEKLENNVEEISNLLNLSIKTNNEQQQQSTPSTQTPTQIIFYGVPGRR